MADRAPLREENKKLPLPLFSAALGAAVSYYGYPLVFSLSGPSRGIFILSFLLFVLAASISLMRVLRFSPVEKIPARAAVLGILVTAAAAGFAFGIAARRSAAGPAETGLPPETVTSVSGILKEDPRTLHGGSGLGYLELRECGGAGGLRASAWGKLTVFFPPETIPRLKEFGRGAEIFAEGVYSSGERGPLFNAKSVHIFRPAPAVESFRTGLRMTFLEQFRKGGAENDAPVWGSLASALLLGVRDDLDTTLADGFRDSGCSHILALSGMHLAILSGVLAFLLRRPLGIRMASLAGAFFIVFYVFVAGSQPSLVRAAIMYLAAAFAVWFSLKGQPLSLLGAAFVIQLLFQNDTGTSLSFILSYLALFGILTLGENFRSLFRGRLPDILSDGFSASLGAFIVTSPVVALYFGVLRPVGIVAGLVVAPLSSLFMLAALAALLAFFLPLPPLWSVLDFLLTRLYRLLEFLVSLAGRVPGISVSPVPVLIFVLLFWLLVFFVQKKDSSYRNRVAPLD